MLWAHFVLLILYLSRETYADVCNPVKCFYLLDTLFKYSEDYTSCQKVTKLGKCLSACFPNDKQNLGYQGFEAVKKDICQEDPGAEMENKCVEKHKFNLFACMYLSSTFQSEQSNVSEINLNCRGAMKGNNCDQIKSLKPCSGRGAYFSSTLLITFFYPQYKSCQDASYTDYIDLKPKISPIRKGMEDLADCLDQHGPSISKCIPKKFTESNVAVEKLDEKETCRSVDTFLGCLKNIVAEECPSSKDTLQTIIQALTLKLVPFCSGVGREPTSGVEYQKTIPETTEIGLKDGPFAKVTEEKLSNTAYERFKEDNQSVEETKSVSSDVEAASDDSLSLAGRKQNDLIRHEKTNSAEGAMVTCILIPIVLICCVCNIYLMFQ